MGDSANTMTLPYLFHSVGGTVWSELDAHKNIGTLHRQLQRAYVDMMIGMVTNTSNGAPDDAKLLAWDQLRQLKSKITLAANSKTPMDAYTKVHLAELLMRITRALDARMTIGSQSGGGGGFSLAQLLGGESEKK